MLILQMTSFHLINLDQYLLGVRVLREKNFGKISNHLLLLVAQLIKPILFFFRLDAAILMRRVMAKRFLAVERVTPVFVLVFLFLNFGVEQVFLAAELELFIV